MISFLPRRNKEIGGKIIKGPHIVHFRTLAWRPTLTSDTYLAARHLRRALPIKLASYPVEQSPKPCPKQLSFVSYGYGAKRSYNLEKGGRERYRESSESSNASLSYLCLIRDWRISFYLCQDGTGELSTSNGGVERRRYRSLEAQGNERGSL